MNTSAASVKWILFWHILIITALGRHDSGDTNPSHGILQGVLYVTATACGCHRIRYPSNSLCTEMKADYQAFRLTRFPQKLLCNLQCLSIL